MFAMETNVSRAEAICQTSHTVNLETVQQLSVRVISPKCQFPNTLRYEVWACAQWWGSPPLPPLPALDSTEQHWQQWKSSCDAMNCNQLHWTAEKQSSSALTARLPVLCLCCACAVPELDYYVVVREAKERQKGTNDSIDDTHIQTIDCIRISVTV